MSFAEFDTAGSWPEPLPCTVDSPAPLKSKSLPSAIMLLTEDFF